MSGHMSGNRRFAFFGEQIINRFNQKFMRYATYFKRLNKEIIKQREVCQRMFDSFGVSYL
jgi:hypothetical protein